MFVLSGTQMMVQLSSVKNRKYIMEDTFFEIALKLDWICISLFSISPHNKTLNDRTLRNKLEKAARKILESDTHTPVPKYSCTWSKYSRLRLTSSIYLVLDQHRVGSRWGSYSKYYLVYELLQESNEDPSIRINQIFKFANNFTVPGAL